ncbi:MAG: hypothetical protein ACHQ2Z_03715 [Elusimicrobiota bacterium]
MNKLLLIVSALLIAGPSRAVVNPPDFENGTGTDASSLVSQARSAKKKTPDPAVVAPPKGLIQLSPRDGDHLLALAKRVVERANVTLSGKVGDNDKYDAYACENVSTSQVGVVAKATTCAKVFHSTGSVLVVALEVVADVHTDGSRTIKGVKIFSGYLSPGYPNAALHPDDGVWIPSARAIEYSNARQLTSEAQHQLGENLDVWARIPMGMMQLDDTCYDSSGGTCG